MFSTFDHPFKIASMSLACDPGFTLHIHQLIEKKSIDIIVIVSDRVPEYLPISLMDGISEFLVRVSIY